MDYSQSQDFIRQAGPLLAKAGLQQLRHWPANKARRTQNAQVLREVLESAGLHVPQYPKEAEPVLLRFPIRIRHKQAAIDEASTRGVDVASWYESTVHPLAVDKLAQIGYEGQCPVAEKAINSIVHLPTNKAISPGKLKVLAEILRRHA